MGITRTNNPLEYDEVDGIVIDEISPAPSIKGVGTGVVILVGQFQRGSHGLTRVSSIKDFHTKYGKSSATGNLQLKNKKFSVLKIVRVEATGAVVAEKTLQAGAVDILTIKAKSKGAYGNSIKVTVETGSVSGKKYTIQDTSAGATEFWPDEIYDNVLITEVATKLANSKLVDVVVESVASEPDNSAISSLTGGADGVASDANYETAIAKCEVEGAGNILFIDEYNQTRNGYLKVHNANTKDKICILSHEEGDVVADSVTDVATLRDTRGGLIFAFNWIQTTIDGISVYTSPASWYASILSQTAPNVDPAYAGNTQFLAGVTGLKLDLTRDEYKQLMEAGISAFEFDSDIGFKIKSGIVTQIADTSKLTVLRRRMADYLTNSVARFLKVYQNAVNSKDNRIAVKGAMLRFIEQNENQGVLPKDSEVQNGKAKLVDIDSENTNDTIAQGKFFIVYKQRIYSSMRFIVLKAEIGESVVVTEQ